MLKVQGGSVCVCVGGHRIDHLFLIDYSISVLGWGMLGKNLCLFSQLLFLALLEHLHLSPLKCLLAVYIHYANYTNDASRLQWHSI